MLNKITDALRNAVFVKTKTQMKSFLGACNLCGRFVKEFAKRACHDNEVTRIDIEPDLPAPSVVQTGAFEDLNPALVSRQC